MKTFLGVALILAVGAAAMLLWSAGHGMEAGVSSSQIFIHGVPVCVTQRGDEIRASVGSCDAVPADPRLRLPPGHPPIGPEDAPVPEENRGTLI